jgi:hypothetical protein
MRKANFSDDFKRDAVRQSPNGPMRSWRFRNGSKERAFALRAEEEVGRVEYQKRFDQSTKRPNTAVQDGVC